MKERGIRMKVLFNLFVLLVLVTAMIAMSLIFHHHVTRHAISRRAPSARQCEFISFKEENKRKSARADVMEPPWLELMNKTGSEDDGLNRIVQRDTFYLAAPDIGRLGNHMFIYASLFGIAWRNRRIPIWLDEGKELCDVFQCRVPVDHLSVASQLGNFTTVAEVGARIYNNMTEHLPAKNVKLYCFLQSWKYFANAEDQLRHDFTFRPETIDLARRMLDARVPPKWRNLNFTRVVIHVRRTDYAGFHDPEPDYFDRSMSYFTDCQPRVQFIVISDDLSWCHRNITDGGDQSVVFLEEAKTPVEAMAVASLCNHAIITIGTFGWWAAWLANGVTIAQSSYPSQSPHAEIYSHDDYYKPDFVMF